MSMDFDQIKSLALSDIHTLALKEKANNNDWKKRGGIGAFMMLARKWDCIENQAKLDGEIAWDIFSTGIVHGLDRQNGILENIRDLRCYLLLVETEITKLINERNCNEEICQDMHQD